MPPQTQGDIFDQVAANPPAAQPKGDIFDQVAAAPPVMATMQATQPQSWLQQAEQDLRQGGGRTIVGRTLGAMQGRGSQGYTGLESGVTPAEANFVGGVPLGAVKMAQGAAQLPQHPGRGLATIGSGALQAAAVPASFIAPEAAEAGAAGAGKAAGALIDKVNPAAMKEAAGGLLQSVAHDANQIPVQLDNSGDAALRMMDWQKKTQLGATVNKYLNRITNPKMGPLTYEEARKWYQLLGGLSSDEAGKLAPPVRRDLVQMVVGLKQDIGNAADQVGRASDYYKGMGDYATAAKYQGWLDAAKKFLGNEAVKATAAGIGGGVGGALISQIYNQATK